MTKDELIERNNILKDGYIKLQNNLELANGWQKKQFEALYYAKVGYLKLELLQLQLAAKALQRQIELAYEAINSNEDPNFELIEERVDSMLADAQLEINEQTSINREAIRFLKNLRSPENYKGISKIYRKLAKNLHPDVNPDLTPEQMDLWHKVLNAYQNLDYERLKAIEIVYENQIFSGDIMRLSENEILTRNNILTEGIKIFEDEYEELMKSFPFNLKDLINDENWVKLQIEEIKSELEVLQTKYNLRLEEYSKIKRAYI